MKRIFFIIVYLFFIASSMFVYQGCEKKEEIKIGSILSLTGSAAVWGNNAKMGMDLALEEINNAGGINGKKVSILYEDSQSLPEKAVSALNKIISTTHIPVIIGDIASSNVLAMAPIAEKNKILLISPGASNPEISKAGKYIFRNWQSDALESKVDANFAYNKLGWRKVACVYIDNAYGNGLMKYFSKNFKEYGGKIVLAESFKQGETNFRPIINKLFKLKIDGIYLPGYPPEMAQFLKQIFEQGLKFNILSVQAFDDPEIIKIAGKATEGVIFSIPTPPDTTRAIVKNFINKYEKKYSKKPGVCSDTGYDALYLIVNGIKKYGYNSEGIREYLIKLKNYYGASGLIEFDENGDVVKPFSFYTIKEGKKILLGK